MVPWCFTAARRPSSDVCSDFDSDSDSDFSADEKPPASAPAPANNLIRVVGADGAVRVYDRPVSAAEVMADNPCHLVCRADAAFTIGQKVPALSAADSLLPGHSYFLLPSQFFHSVLSFVSLASSLLLAGNSATTAAATKVRPFRISKSPAGALQIIVCDGSSDDTMKVKKDTKERRISSSGGGGSSSRVCTDEGLEKEYREMVEARRERLWTPKLETIGECETERVRRGEGLLVFGFATRTRTRRTRWWRRRWWWKRATTATTTHDS